jgi:hypothetical protein
MRALRSRLPGHSTVAAYLALFTALGGVSYAAVNLPNNSVGPGEIKKNAVKAQEIAKNAVRTNEVKNFSLLCTDFKQDQVACAAGQPTAGQPGPPGTPYRAIALVDNGTSPSFLPAVPEQGFESVTYNSVGVDCLVPSPGIDSASDPPLITIEYTNSAGDNFTAMWDQATGNCNDGEYEIQTYTGDTGNETDNAAYVIIVP